MSSPIKTRSKVKVKMSTDNCKIGNFGLPEFSGEPDKLDWFIQQARELVALNKYDDKCALYLLRSKLSGAALHYFQNSPECRAVDKFELALEKLVKFFGEEASPSADLARFQNITMQPGESVRNLAHRIDLAAHKAYSFINDQNALSKIKSLQLLNAIPLSLREKIMLDNVTEYQQMVTKAHQVQTIQESLLASSNPFVAAHCPAQATPVLSDTEQLSALTQKMEMLSTSIENIMRMCPICRQSHQAQSCPLLKQQQQSPYDNVICLFCGKQNHVIMNCRQYKASLGGRSSNYVPQGSPNFQNEYLRYPPPLPPRFPPFGQDDRPNFAPPNFLPPVTNPRFSGPRPNSQGNLNSHRRR